MPEQTKAARLMQSAGIPELVYKRLLAVAIQWRKDTMPKPVQHAVSECIIE